uniref:Uncharacterized protein n=1 Tax=Cacopsylla melanoneura TaxID=428564 RepID=A0A8D8RC72_9HEMI
MLCKYKYKSSISNTLHSKYLHIVPTMLIKLLFYVPTTKLNSKPPRNPGLATPLPFTPAVSSIIIVCSNPKLRITFLPRLRFEPSPSDLPAKHCDHREQPRQFKMCIMLKDLKL